MLPSKHKQRAYMRKALALAEKGLYTSMPNPRVGCIIVKDDVIVGHGWHEKAGAPHAEVMALKEAGKKAQGAVVYVTLEPCNHHNKTPPCCDALIAAQVGAVVCAMHDPNPLVKGKGIDRLRAAGIAVDTNICATEALEINKGFCKRMECGLPYVTAKSAMSMDGRTAMPNGDSKWITGKAARMEVQHLRARSCAILTGSGTVVCDDPQLNVRYFTTRQPLRVAVDSGQRIPAKARMFHSPGKGIVLTASAHPALPHQIIPTTQAGKIDLPQAMLWFGQQECNEVLLEAGASLCGAMLQAQLIDRFIIYIAPVFMGSEARPLCTLPIDQFSQRQSMEIMKMEAVGDDWRVTVHPQYSS